MLPELAPSSQTASSPPAWPEVQAFPRRQLGSRFLIGRLGLGVLVLGLLVLLYDVDVGGDLVRPIMLVLAERLPASKPQKLLEKRLVDRVGDRFVLASCHGYNL